MAQFWPRFFLTWFEAHSVLLPWLIMLLAVTLSLARGVTKGHKIAQNKKSILTENNYCTGCFIFFIG